jgi:hypothetical protein
MKTSKFLLIVARIAQFGLLTILFAVIFIQTSQICAPYMPDMSLAQPGPIPSPLDFLVVSAGHAAVVMILILSSRWVSWKLSLAIFLAYFGVTTVMAQIETAYFLTGLTLPPGLLPRLVEMGLLNAVIFIPLAVVILWRVRKGQIDSSPNKRLVMPLRQWVWKMAAIMPIYLLLYYSAGYFIAWQNPELVAFYGGTDPGSFFAQMLSIFQNDPWLTPFQMMRSLLWVLFVLPVVRMTRGGAWWTAVVVGLLLAVPMNIGHILPNPLFPQASIRLSHLIETGSSNFVFGSTITWLFHRSHRSLADLFGRRSSLPAPRVETQPVS